MNGVLGACKGAAAYISSGLYTGGKFVLANAKSATGNVSQWTGGALMGASGMILGERVSSAWSAYINPNGVGGRMGPEPFSHVTAIYRPVRNGVFGAAGNIAHFTELDQVMDDYTAKTVVALAALAAGYGLHEFGSWLKAAPRQRPVESTSAAVDGLESLSPEELQQYEEQAHKTAAGFEALANKAYQARCAMLGDKASEAKPEDQGVDMEGAASAEETSGQ